MRNITENFFAVGVGCAGAGLILAQVAQHGGREPEWAIPILFCLMVGSIVSLAVWFISEV